MTSFVEISKQELTLSSRLVIIILIQGQPNLITIYKMGHIVAINETLLGIFLAKVWVEKSVIHDKALLIQSLTHKSYAADFSETIPHNERLEFVGDSILWSSIATLLFVHHPDKEESDMTLYKIALVREETLATVARDIGIDQLVLVSKWEEKMQGRNKDAILADTLEAFIGYIAIALWYTEAYQFVEKFVYSKIHTIVQATVRSYKTQLQERAQKKYQEIPVYVDTIEDQEKSGNVLSYRSDVSVHTTIMWTGYGSSKKKAQEDAAMVVMTQFMAWQGGGNK